MVQLVVKESIVILIPWAAQAWEFNKVDLNVTLYVSYNPLYFPDALKKNKKSGKEEKHVNIEEGEDETMTWCLFNGLITSESS